MVRWRHVDRAATALVEFELLDLGVGRAGGEKAPVGYSGHHGVHLFLGLAVMAAARRYVQCLEDLVLVRDGRKLLAEALGKDDPHPDGQTEQHLGERVVIEDVKQAGPSAVSLVRDAALLGHWNAQLVDRRGALLFEAVRQQLFHLRTSELAKARYAH